MATSAKSKYFVSDKPLGLDFSDITVELINAMTWEQFGQDSVITVSEQGIDTQTASLQSLQTGLEITESTTSKIKEFTIELNPSALPKDPLMQYGGIVSIRCREIENAENKNLVGFKVEDPDGSAEFYDADMYGWTKNASSNTDPKTVTISLAPKRQPFPMPKVIV